MSELGRKLVGIKYMLLGVVMVVTLEILFCVYVKVGLFPRFVFSPVYQDRPRGWGGGLNVKDTLRMLFVRVFFCPEKGYGYVLHVFGISSIFLTLMYSRLD